MEYDVNSIFYWWPIIEKLNVPKPKTTLIPYKGSIFIDPEKFNSEFDALVENVGDVCDEYGYPVFIRCGGLSGKHDWKDTCYITRRQNLSQHIFNIIQKVLMVMGVRLDFDGIAVREFLNLEQRFTAFNGMPIAKEFRFFARNGEYECHHPYWPPTSISRPSIDNWYDELKSMQNLSDDELELLKAHTSEVAQALDRGPLGSGWWSIDFCKTVSGNWYITDLGTGGVSFHWNTCPHAPEGMKVYPLPDDPEKLAEIHGPMARAEIVKKFKERYEI